MTGSQTLRESLDRELLELARLRDEIRLKLHLAGLEAKSAWKSLEPRLDALEQEARAEGVVAKDASLALARDLKQAFSDFRGRL
ncbi:MAG: hypothetical protein U0263_02890 [Polyangiaceae bacterium]